MRYLPILEELFESNTIILLIIGVIIGIIYVNNMQDSEFTENKELINQSSLQNEILEQFKSKEEDIINE